MSFEEQEHCKTITFFAVLQIQNLGNLKSIFYPGLISWLPYCKAFASPGDEDALPM